MTPFADLMTLELIDDAGEAGLPARGHGDVINGIDELRTVSPTWTPVFCSRIIRTCTCIFLSSPKTWLGLVSFHEYFKTSYLRNKLNVANACLGWLPRGGGAE